MTSDTGYSYAGVKSYDMSKTKLVVFSSCRSSESYWNLCEYTKRNGADTVIGWPTPIGWKSSRIWTTYFFEKMAEGATVSDAVRYADSHDISDSEIYKQEIHGDHSLTLSTRNRSLAFKSNSIDERKHYLNIDVNGTELREKVSGYEEMKTTISDLTEVKVISLISNYINKSVDKSFSKSDMCYEVIKKGNNVDIYKISKMVNGVESDQSFTAFVENGVITELYDNTKAGSRYLDLLNARPLLAKNMNVLDKKQKKIYITSKGKVYTYVKVDYEIDGAYGSVEWLE